MNMKTIEAEILEFATAQWGEKDLPAIGLKVGEEAGEVAGALVKIPEGRATLEDLDKEVGDLLIVLSQIAAKRGWTLEQLRAKRFEQIKARALVRDDLPSGIGTVLSTRPLSDEEKAAVEADLMELRNRIIADLKKTPTKESNS